MSSYVFKIATQEPEKLLEAVTMALGADSRIAKQVAEQMPKPTVEEPTEFGSIIRAGSPQDAPATEFDLWTPTPRRKHYWMSQSGLCEVWSELTDVEVLRVGIDGGYNHSLQQVRDLLFRSPSGLLAVEEAADAYKDLRKGLSVALEASPAAAAGSWRDGFNMGTKNTRERIYNRQTALKAKLITSVEKTAIDKALAQIEADIEDHEGPRRQS